MMARANPTSGKYMSTIWVELFFLGFILSMVFVYIDFSGTHFFSFDEFEVLYAGASILRGKALYADQIEPHFPLFNMCIAYIVRLFGFKTTTILVARYFMLAINGVALIFIYRIGEIIWDRRTGLLAVCLALSSIVFLNRAIEIRHDVFNMSFNVIGAYYGLRYIKEKRVRYIILSGIFLGIAFASTQKALVWNAGIIIGLGMYYIRNKSFRNLLKLNSFYLITLTVPLAISISFLMLLYNEDIYMFFKYGVAKQIVFYAPYTKELYPFPYSRYEIFKDLIFQNNLLYALGISGIFATIIIWVRSNTERIVIAAWALIGVFFYVTAKRPFFQTFLPSVPPISILAAGLLSDLFKDLKDLNSFKKIGIGITAILLLFIWPSCLVYSQIPRDSKMMRQMDNISFCLNNLKDNDKVLCFTSNQIFFDPVIKINWFKGGKPIWDYDADWFEQRMIDQQCKVIINDYRMRLLNKEIRNRIQQNYLPTQTGDILIPGFKIGPGKILEKKIWIEGHYYSPTRNLEINCEKIKSRLVRLEQKRYRIKNNSNRNVFLVYIFHKGEFLKGSPDYPKIMGRM